MHYKYLTHHVWHTIPPKFELYSCSENPVETSISQFQLSDLYLDTNHHERYYTCMTDICSLMQCRLDTMKLRRYD